MQKGKDRRLKLHLTFPYPTKKKKNTWEATWNDARDSGIKVSDL